MWGRLQPAGGAGMTYAVGGQDIARFWEDGAICLRRVFDADWIARLQPAADRIVAGGGTAGRTEFTAREYTATHQTGRFVSELFLWRQDPVFRSFVLESPAAEVAGRLLRSDKVNFLFDHLLVKEPGTSNPTKWHHDLPHWPIEGDQVLTLWIALDPVRLETGAVQYVKGSHRWGTRYRPVLPNAPDAAAIANAGLPECPAIHKEPGKYEILTWDLEPGDCIAFHALTIHGAGGNKSATQRRRGLATRWTGDDIRFVPGNFVLKLNEDPGLKPGDPLDSDLFPVVWRRDSGPANRAAR
jgi:ectoine hydroxylase-related dioxygenase (phytanoyl-CoA dioxygenase family)